MREVSLTAFSETPGRFVADVGQFRAWLQTTHTSKTPVLGCQFRILGHPSTFEGLKYYRDKLDVGEAWTRSNVAGWSVQRIPEMLLLADRLIEPMAMSRHPRYPVVDAWKGCLDLLPSVLRAVYDRRDGRYLARKFAADRADAVDALKRQNRKLPPRFWRLPEGYFDL